MPKMDEKLQMIATSIILQAEQERGEIVANATRIREEEISAYRDQVIEGMYERVQKETRAIRQKTLEERAKAEQRAHRELLGRREELTASVFSAARLRLLDYVSTPGYRTVLLERIAEGGTGWDHSATTVCLRQGDMELSPEIQRRLPGCRVEAARSIRIGGFRLRNEQAGLLLDETLDRQLEDQRPWFLQQCGMRVL